MTSISSNGVLSGFASDLGTVQRKLFLNFSRPTEIVFCHGPRFFGGLRHFQKEESRLKMNHEAEGQSSSRTDENVDRIRDLVRSDRRLTVRMIGEEVLERLRKRVIRVRPNIKNKWVLHHDNAPCHTAISINEFLASKNIPVAPQPPYSPDLSPCDFFLFPKLKNYLKGNHFGTVEKIQTAVTDQLKVISVSEFQHCYKEWKKRLQRCVASEGSYFEGGNIEL